MRTWTGCLVAVLWVAPLVAEQPEGPVKDTWEEARLEGVHAGYFRTTVQAFERNGRKLFRANQELNLTVRRYGEIALLRMESGTEEDANGKVVGVSMKMYQGGGTLTLTGKLEDGVMKVEISGGRKILRQLPWDDKVIGLLAQERIFQTKKVKPGDRLTWKTFEPTVNAVITVHAAIHKAEEVDVLGMRKKLVKVVVTSDKLEVPGASVQLPPMTVWLDKDHLPVARQVELPGIGKILLAHTTRAKAQARLDVARLPDLGLRTLIPLNRKIPRAHDSKALVYRVTIQGDSPETALAQDDRQKIKNVAGQSFELHVHAIRSPGEGKETPAGEEFQKSCYYLNSDDARVRELARRAVGTETDPWQKARRIEHWVHANVKTDNSVPFSPAGEVARRLRGDCRQHAMLAAAMCRAADVPSRTAVGVLYVEDRSGRPVFGFHMWFEVFVRGHWVALDAILGQGGIGAAHIKVSDQSWHDTQSLTPLLPVSRVLGKMKIEVLEPDSN
jgi:Transglutaminase-like superfamily